MYTTYFGFENKPFKPKDSKDYYHNDNFDSACADILSGIREQRGFILLTGEAGFGKTLVLHRCMAEAADIFFILLNNANLDFPDILNYLCISLQLPAEGLNIEQQSRLLLDTVAAHARRNQPVALLIDDAQHLRIGVLSHLLDFVETAVEPDQRLRIVLAGLPEIEGKLRQPELRRLHEQVQVRCHLERLSGMETELFINHQFKAAGYAGEGLFSPAVIERIDHYSQGVPRAVAMLCDAMFLFASLESEHEITPGLVDEAARNCFLGERAQSGSGAVGPLWQDAVGDTVPAPADGDGFDLRLDLDLPLDFDLDLDLDRTSVAEWPMVAAGEELKLAPIPPRESMLVPPVAESPAEVSPTPLMGWASVAPPAEPAPPAVESTASVLREFAQLLGELAAKQEYREPRDREAVDYFRNRYLRWSRGGPVQADEYQRRIARLTETQQPVLVSLAVAVSPASERENMLCALLVNPSWWLYREIRLRLRSPDLVFVDEGRVPPLRLLDGREAQPVYIGYRCPHAGPVQTTLWLELDLCDHRGEWHAYDNRFEIRLDFTRPVESKQEPMAGVASRSDRFWPDPLLDKTASSGWLLDDPVAEREETEADTLACTLPLELEADPERSYSLRATSTASGQALSRGTPLTRALLLPENSAHAVARIELVSRPLMIFGRHSAAAGTGFGDFTLGFVPKYNRISRLHSVICALGDQLALMSASDEGYTYTGRNGQRLERGSWQLLEVDDVLDVCDLYRLKLFLAWDHKGEHALLDWDSQEPRDKFGRYLLELVDVLHQRDRQANADELRDKLKTRYLKLLHMQERVARLNGVGNPGALLYARFEREDAARRQIVHYYVPKWLSLGSSPQAGLRVNAPGVVPRHAELLFRDGMYWIQNLAEPGSVRVGCHALATNEVLALEVGDVLRIGTARFSFEAY
ncbi:MAG TPA: AAA family ATPase [Candidatus Competibacter sp.]|nr:AAA family ATPase [Candidatus Competibacteraceae bacterium]HRW66543.1 AAA family ATPase [Candidatus Competibacter sp.]